MIYMTIKATNGTGYKECKTMDEVIEALRVLDDLDLTINVALTKTLGKNKNKN